MEYRACVEELLFSSQVQHMKSIRHHPGVSCYEHSVFVSYVAWYLADRWGADARTAARAGLLHDLYLYDPRTLPSYRQCRGADFAAVGGRAVRRPDRPGEKLHFGPHVAPVPPGAPQPRGGRGLPGRQAVRHG